MRDEDVVSLIAALLRGEARGCASVEAQLIDAARHHGVMPLLDAAFSRGVQGPPGLAGASRKDALVHAMHEQLQQAELASVLSALAAKPVPVLLMKGAALAYSHYPSPALRPRADCDLLVPPGAREPAVRALTALGFRRASGPAGEYVGYQAALVRGACTVDLHWRISDMQSFAWLFTFDDLATQSRGVPALHPGARRLGDAHALLLALLHRAGTNVEAGRGSGDRLIWLHDFKLLVDTIDDETLARFLALACDKRVAAVALDGLRACARHFPSSRLAAVIATLERSPMAGSGAALLHAGRWRREWLELRALPRAGARLAYLGRRLYPHADHLRERFPGPGGLPALHARRWLAGMGRAISSRRSSRA